MLRDLITFITYKENFYRCFLWSMGEEKSKRLTLCPKRSTYIAFTDVCLNQKEVEKRKNGHYNDVTKPVGAPYEHLLHVDNLTAKYRACSFEDKKTGKIYECTVNIMEQAKPMKRLEFWSPTEKEPRGR